MQRLIAALVLIAAAFAACSGPPPGPAAAPTPPPATPASTPAPRATAPAAPPLTLQPATIAETPIPPGIARAALPWRLRIPTIGVDSPVAPVGLDDQGRMASPAAADLIGWYELGPRPGEANNAVVSGHVAWPGGKPAFARLAELRPGDAVLSISSLNQEYRFTVKTVDRYRTDDAPVVSIFGPTAESTLTLITCAGEVDARTGEFRDRVVVRAVKP